MLQITYLQPIYMCKMIPHIAENWKFSTRQYHPTYPSSPRQSRARLTHFHPLRPRAGRDIFSIHHCHGLLRNLPSGLTFRIRVPDYNLLCVEVSNTVRVHQMLRKRWQDVALYFQQVAGVLAALWLVYFHRFVLQQGVLSGGSRYGWVVVVGIGVGCRLNKRGCCYCYFWGFIKWLFIVWGSGSSSIGSRVGGGGGGGSCDSNCGGCIGRGDVVFRYYYICYCLSFCSFV